VAFGVYELLFNVIWGEEMAAEDQVAQLENSISQGFTRLMQIANDHSPM